MKSKKHILITGANGTLAPYIIEHAKGLGYEITIWDRNVVSIEEQSEINSFIDEVKPDMFYHIATGDPEWIRRIIKGLKRHSIPLVFTSTESVFDESQMGPFYEDTEPLSESDYGKYKRVCEEIVRSEYMEHSYIVRLGWQIGLKPEKNNMLAWIKNQDKVIASTEWIPSTSFMPDTARTLLEKVPELDYGLYHLDGNNFDLSFYEIVTSLNQTFDLGVEVVKDHSFVRNNRLLSKKLKTPSINNRFKK